MVNFKRKLKVNLLQNYKKDIHSTENIHEKIDARHRKRNPRKKKIFKQKYR
jgi:hypothetical protein